MSRFRTVVCTTLGLLALTVVASAADDPPNKSPEKAKAKAPPIRIPEGTTIHKNLTYVADGHERQKLDLYVPPGRGPKPLVVWIHGGGWQGGSKDGFNPAQMLLERGYAVASVGYRLSQHAVFPAQIQDCKAAIRFLRDQAGEHGLDPKHIGVWGASAGGHLVALLGACEGTAFDDGKPAKQSARVQAVCDWFGPADFANWSGSAAGPVRGGNADSPVTKLFGGPVAERLALAKSASPTEHASADDPPLLIVHGDKDATVPLHQSRRLYDAMKAKGVDVKLHVIEGAAHGGAQFIAPDVFQMEAEFFDRHLKAKN